MSHTKGQLMSEDFFFKSSEKWTKNFCHKRLGQQLKILSSCFLEELKIPKFPFEINWPLGASEQKVISKNASRMSLSEEE